MVKTGILVCGHGSRKETGIKGLIDFTAKLQKIRQEDFVTYCFLDLSSPDFMTAVGSIYNRNIRKLVVAPAFLFGGIHVNYELPNLISQCREAYPDLTVSIAEYLGTSDRIIEACYENIQLAGHKSDVSQRNDHCLVAVGAGTSIVSANADMAKLTRTVWESCGFGFAQYAFVSNITFPSIDSILSICCKSGFTKIVILPVLFFPGVYIDKIYLAAEKAKELFGADVTITETLGNSHFLVEAMNEKIDAVRF